MLNNHYTIFNTSLEKIKISIRSLNDFFRYRKKLKKIESKLKDVDDIEKWGALHTELVTSMELIKRGLAELQSLGPSNTFSYTALQSLAMGFEKMLKVCVCFGNLNKTGNYPKNDTLKYKLGHKLLDLNKEILKKYFKVQSHTKLDFEFLEQNKELRELLSILQEFASGGRYYNFDRATGIQNKKNDPILKWNQFEMKIIFSNPNLKAKLKTGNFFQDEYSEVSYYFVCIFEKFAWAIARRFLFDLGSVGKQISPVLIDFYSLNPDNFGSKNYRSNLYPISDLKVQIKPNKVLRSGAYNRIDFLEEWPFIVDSITIEKWDEHSAVVIIENTSFALNGIAKSKFKLIGVHDAGKAIKGKSIGTFIQLALKLN